MDKEEIEQAKKEIANAFKICQKDVDFQQNVFEVSHDYIKCFDFDICAKYPLCFQGCMFDCEIIVKSNRGSFQKLVFLDCCFEEVKICSAIFSDIFIMSDCVFEKNMQIQAIFEDNVYFDNCKFGSADFSKCEFKRAAGFYGSTFKQIPNFSQVIFGGDLNLANTNLDFDFEKIQKAIYNTYNYEKYETNKTQRAIIYRHHIANNFRDTFRIFKSVSIKNNNLLDASDHHRIELYCKEIELDFKKPEIFTKEWVDLWILRFYRHTSDHHTDLPKVFHSTLILITIFGILSASVVCCSCKYTICTAFFNCLVALLFVSSFLAATMSKVMLMKNIRRFVVGFSYLITAFILVSSPKYLIPVIKLFTKEHSPFDPLSTIGAVYTILSIIMIYSLTKTMRKNSIVPN